MHGGSRGRRQGVGHTVVRTPAHPHRVLHAGRSRPGQGPGAVGGRGRPTRTRDHRPREHVRRPGLLRRLPRRRHQPGDRHRGVHGGRVPARTPGTPGQDRRHRWGRRRWGEALLPPDPVGRVHRGVPEPAQAVVGRLPGGLLLQAPARLGAAGPPQYRAHRHHRLPGRGGAPGPAGRRPGQSRDLGRPAPGHLRQGQPLRGAAGPRAARAAQDQPGPGGDRPAHRRPVARHQRQPLHPPPGPCGPRRPAVRADRGPHRRSQAVQVRGPGALPEVGRRDAPPLLRAPRGL